MANINVKCTFCDATLSVAAELNGKLAHCPICNKDFTVQAEVTDVFNPATAPIQVQPLPSSEPGQANCNTPQTADAPNPAVPPVPNTFMPQNNQIPVNGNPTQPCYQPGFIPQNMVKTYLVESILVTLLCCMPLGVIAIVFAAHAGSLLAMQQYQLALKSAETAKKWMLASLICGIVFSLLYAAATLVSAAAQNTL